MKRKPSAANSRWRLMRLTRRLSQISFLGLFFLLIFATASLTGAGFDARNSASVPWPVEAFLNIDPFIGLTVILSTGTLPATLLLGLIVLGSAFFLGRAFCSWVCPMGTLNHACSETAPTLRGAARIKANRHTRKQHFKYYLLAALLLAAFFGSAIGGLFDPISLLTRGIATVVLPPLDYIFSHFVSATAGSGNATVQQFSDFTWNAFSGTLIRQNGLLVSGGILITVVFAAILIANRFMPRLWCRWICPLGATLGVAGRFGILTLKKDESLCTKCNKCEKNCSGAASPIPGTKWQRAECDLCFNCVAQCPENALAFGFVGDKIDAEVSLPDLKRRHLLTSVATGALIVPALRGGSLSSPAGRPDPQCIRPPGSVTEEDFLRRCIRCGQCMKICPNNALHPALDEAGLEGLWTPVLVPRIGYCEPTCTLCTQVCPTAAIVRVLEDQKTGRNGQKLLSIGTAFFDQGRCLPWAMGIPCTVCEEFCPTSPKAIYTVDVERTVNGKTVMLKMPYVDPTKCNGCGACENVCPVHDKAAIRVTCVGETRNPDNKLLL